MKGKLIKLELTNKRDIELIIKFENQNSQFVHSYTKEKHLEYINGENCFHFSIRKIEDNKLIGHLIGFGKLDTNKSFEFRRISIAEKGKGYGREAIQLLKQLCFEQLKYHRLWLDVYDDNERAIHLYESEGFKKEGKLRDCIKTENGYRSLRIYSILEDEYQCISSKQSF